MRVSIKVQGLRECEQALRDLKNTLDVSTATARNTVGRALEKALRPIEQSMEAQAPVRGGHLKVSIDTSTKLSKRQKAQHQKRSPVERYVGAGPLPQAHLQEFGTAHQAPQPFGRPAVDANLRNLPEAVAEELRVEIAKTAERAARKAKRLLARSKS